MVFFTGTFGLNFQMTSALMATEVFDKGADGVRPARHLHGGRLARPARCVAARRDAVRHRLIVGAALPSAPSRSWPALLPSYAVFALITPLLGLSALTMITAANAFVQLHTDAGMRGRVMALYMMIFMGGTPLGAPLIGWIGEQFGARDDAVLRRRHDDPRCAGGQRGVPAP